MLLPFETEPKKIGTMLEPCVCAVTWHAVACVMYDMRVGQ